MPQRLSIGGSIVLKTTRTVRAGKEAPATLCCATIRGGSHALVTNAVRWAYANKLLV